MRLGAVLAELIRPFGTRAVPPRAGMFTRARYRARRPPPGRAWTCALRLDNFCKGLQHRKAHSTAGCCRVANGCQMNATIHDVAEAAGVSPSTVSRAFTMPDLLRGDTRERVLAAAKRLGYQPNRAARGLITGRTGNIGVIVPDLSNPFFPAVLKGAQARAGVGLRGLPRRRRRGPGARGGAHPGDG